MQYRVINPYRIRGTGARIEPGTIVTLSRRAGDDMVARRLVVPIDRAASPETATRTPQERAVTREATPRHVGGGWYELPGGERVRGREAAMQRMQEQ